MTWRYRYGGNKYKAERATYDGYIYHSKKEAAYAAELDLRKKAGDIVRWERQIPIDIRINGKHWRTWIIDFKVTYPDGQIEFVEVKGFQTTEYRMKRDAAELTFFADHPEYSLVVV